MRWIIAALLVLAIGCSAEPEQLQPAPEQADGPEITSSPEAAPDVEPAVDEPDASPEQGDAVAKADEKLVTRSVKPKGEAVLTKEETIAACDSFCQVDKDAYCQEQRSFEDDALITGTCRAFAKKGHVEGFNRCESFCNTYPKSTTECSVEGARDSDCDGQAD
jgi:hypothetical protein